MKEYPKHIQNRKDLVDRLDCVIESLKENFDVHKVILFGSFARGTKMDTNTSEIDLIVIAKSTDKFTTRLIKARKVCKGTPAVNILVYTPREFEIMLEDGEGFLEDAVQEGYEIYVK